MESAYGWKILVPGVWWLSMACRLSHACMHTHVRKYEHMHLHNYMHRLSRHISSYTRQKQDILESDWLPLKPLTALVYHAYCTNILRSVTNPDTLHHILYKIDFAWFQDASSSVAGDGMAFMLVFKTMFQTNLQTTAAALAGIPPQVEHDVQGMKRQKIKHMIV